MAIANAYFMNPSREMQSAAQVPAAQEPSRSPAAEKETFAGMLWDAGKKLLFGEEEASAETPQTRLAAAHESLPRSSVTQARMTADAAASRPNPFGLEKAGAGRTDAGVDAVEGPAAYAGAGSNAGAGNPANISEHTAEKNTAEGTAQHRRHVGIDYVRTDALNAMSQQLLSLGGGVAVSQLRGLLDTGRGGNGMAAGATTAAGLGTGRGLRMPAVPQGPRGISSRPRWGQSVSENLGGLCARFESGGKGSAAIGYDSHGGTSYGKYQVSSKQGSFDDFVKYLEKNAPDIARKLKSAGPADTGGRTGRMPDMWKKIAEKEGQRFEELQENFIRGSHFQPALDKILSTTSLKMENISEALQEVIWSTAVQHGVSGASRIFKRATARLEGQEGGKDYEKKLISQVYSIRGGQFGSSSPQVQASVQNRFREEKMLALQLAEGKPLA